MPTFGKWLDHIAVDIPVELLNKLGHQQQYINRLDFFMGT